MPKSITSLLITACLLAANVVCVHAADSSAGLDALQGKWSVSKTNREGQAYSQTLEFKKDKLTFQMLEPDKTVRFMAKGTVKTEKAASLNILTISNIEAGRSADELAPVDDRRTSVYTLRGGKLIVASNFDTDRENERPGIDSYDRMESAKEGAASDSKGTASDNSESKLLGTWKMVITMGDNDVDYDLRIGKANGKLEATVISPRSGEYKAKTVAFKDNELTAEVDRVIEGNTITFVYKAKLMGNELVGTAAAKGFEDQFTGKLKARK